MQQEMPSALASAVVFLYAKKPTLLIVKNNKYIRTSFHEQSFSLLLFISVPLKCDDLNIFKHLRRAQIVFYFIGIRLIEKYYELFIFP